MQSISDYIKGLSQRLIFKVVLVFLATTAVAGALLYTASLQFPLPESYGRAIATISLYKVQIIKNGFYIYMVYALFVLAGVAVIGWIYTYRVARPFKKVRDYAAEMAKGNFDINAEFGDYEDMHPLAEAVNRMARDCGARRENIHRGVEALAREVRALDAALRSGDREEFERIYRSLSARAGEIEAAFSELKL